MTLEALLAAAGVVVPLATAALDKMGLAVPKWVYGAVAAASIALLGVAVGLYWAGGAPQKPQHDEAASVASPPSKPKAQTAPVSATVPTPTPVVPHHHHRTKTVRQPAEVGVKILPLQLPTNQPTMPVPQPTQPAQQNCQVTGGTNNGTITQNCGNQAPASNRQN